MARLPTSPTSQLEAPPTNLPYSSHPIFHLRKILLIVACLGAFLSFFSADPHDGPFFSTSLFLLVVSIFFALCDLTSYALKKAHHPDQNPEWPRVIFIVGDGCLAVVLHFVFWTTIAAIEGSPWYYGSTVCPAYAALSVFICSILHARSFWKELMARCEKKWLRRLTVEPCPRCGYHEDGGMETSREQCEPQPPNTFTYAGPSAAFRPATVHTPTSEETMLEEGLLIGSDLGPSYGAMQTTEHVVCEPVEVVVGKGKKKRVVEGSSKTGDS